MSTWQTPLVSVVIPTYNRRDLIGPTLQSVLNQTYTNLEMLVVDDGSTDGTRDFVLDTFRGDSRLRYLNQPNQERAVARNHGIRAARGEYIAFLDSDDLWLPAKLERQVASLNASRECDCCYSLFDVLGDESAPSEPGSFPAGDLFESLLNHCMIGSMTPLIRRHCFEVVGGFCDDRRLLCFEDWEMWTRLASRFQWTLVPEVLGRYRLHSGNTQHAADWAIDELRIELLQRYELSDVQKRQLADYVQARRWHWAANLHLLSPRTSIRLLSRIAISSPRTLIARNYWGLMARSMARLATSS